MIFRCIKFPFFYTLFNLFSISIIVLMSFVINNWYLGFYSVLSSNKEKLPYLIILFIIYNIISHASVSLKEFTQYSISIRWRANIIAKIASRIKPHLIDISNPDQRLCEDSNEFVSYFTKLISDIILNAVSLIVFMISLTKITSFGIAYKLILGMTLYSLLCNQIISLYVKKYILKLGGKNEGNEADLRIKVYELHQSKSGFSIGLKRLVVKALRKMSFHQKKYFNHKTLIAFLQKLFDENIGMIFPYILIYLFSSKSWNIGLVMQIVNCLMVIKFRMMFFSENIQDIYIAKIGYYRLKRYINHLIDHKDQFQHGRSENLNIAFCKIEVSNMILLNNIKLEVKKNDSLCLYGESGIGKTTLLRYINNSMKNIEGLVSYPGKMICLCLGNLKNYLISRDRYEDHFSQGELQKECISCLIEEKPDWIVWDEFCLGLSQESRKREFFRLKNSLKNIGLVILTQDKLDFCDKSIHLERFA
ncbi:ATP-binding cassette domain-containing protein [Candidatus Cytomitobacter indipagum]|uniref:ATP-binding cassette domain-containing protein n=1 Tax=Candidatus Cytomitobacter indipagum TaxID=2601575 RepID=A0A5C0UDK9_9PROT|nr:ATP-binding cassette domain-containing protein [Candidatus Cytomitobacter indipagum]QEK37839.1 ATP-binding cassette domain-containing protein [Candidatus Cytomitobacter indipagum]